MRASRSGGNGRGGGKRATTVDLGRQSRLPPAWPLPAATEVWVLTSTSGASALTNEARAAPYQALSARLAEIPWPRRVVPACVQTGVSFGADQGPSDGGASGGAGGGRQRGSVEEDR
jgi:hypothetical protein